MPWRLSQTISCSRPETEPDFQLLMINKHCTLPFAMSGYFFNLCRCVLFTLKLSYKLAKAHRVWKKAGFRPRNVHRNGKWLTLLPLAVVPQSWWNGWGELKSFSRPVEMFADQAGFWGSSARQDEVKCNSFGSCSDFDFLAVGEKFWTFNRYENPLIWYRLVHGRLSVS